MSFAQTHVLGKGNELAGIQELLDLLDIKGCVVSIDAIGCQTKIATQIQAAGGYSILAVKNNQLELSSEIQNAFSKVTVQDTTEKTDYTGGRIEKRSCEVIQMLDTYVDEAKRWSGSETVIKMTTIHENIKQPLNRVILSVRFNEMPLFLSMRFNNIGKSRTSCIGIWMSRFRKTAIGSEQRTPLRIFR
jgi:hypothetical protein